MSSQVGLERLSNHICCLYILQVGTIFPYVTQTIIMYNTWQKEEILKVTHSFVFPSTSDSFGLVSWNLWMSSAVCNKVLPCFCLFTYNYIIISFVLGYVIMWANDNIGAVWCLDSKDFTICYSIYSQFSSNQIFKSFFLLQFLQQFFFFW